MRFTQNEGSTININNNLENVLNESENLAGFAKEIEKSQNSANFDESLDQKFQESFSEIIIAKQEQIERLENRLELLISEQEARVQLTQQKQPGMLSLPSTRAKWQEGLRHQQASLQRMNDRLEVVKDIKDTVTTTGSKIDAMARTKLRHQDPQLVDVWEEMQHARRLHETHLKRLQKEKQRHESGLTGQPEQAARGHRISLYHRKD